MSEQKEKIDVIITFALVANLKVDRHIDMDLSVQKENLLINVSKLLNDLFKNSVKGIKFGVFPTAIKTSDPRENIILPDKGIKL